MRIYVYEDNEEKVNKLCEKFEISPTKLVNTLLLYLDEQISHKQRANIEDELFKRITR